MGLGDVQKNFHPGWNVQHEIHFGSDWRSLLLFPKP